MKCRNCKTKSLKKIIFLGSQPLKWHFYKKKNQKIEKKFSLDLFFCTKCKLVQLGKKR